MASLCLNAYRATVLLQLLNLLEKLWVFLYPNQGNWVISPLKPFSFVLTIRITSDT